jgi:hypothetical protein
LVLGAASYEYRITRGIEPPSIWQLGAFSALNCMFYGFSFADLAVRSLLRVGTDAFQEGIKHVALVRTDDPAGGAPPSWGWAEDEHFKRIGTLRVGGAEFRQQKRFLRILLELRRNTSRERDQLYSAGQRAPAAAPAP